MRTAVLASDGESANITHPNTHPWRRAAADAQSPWNTSQTAPNSGLRVPPLGVRTRIRRITGPELSLTETSSESSLCEDLSQAVVLASRNEDLWVGRARHRRIPPC